MTTTTTERPVPAMGGVQPATWVCENCQRRDRAQRKRCAGVRHLPLLRTPAGSGGGRRAPQPDDGGPVLRARRTAARRARVARGSAAEQAGPVGGAGVLEREAEHEQLLAGGEPAVRRPGDHDPVAGLQVRVEQRQQRRAPPRRSARRPRRPGRGRPRRRRPGPAAVPATAHWRAAVETSRSMWSIRAQRAVQSSRAARISAGASPGAARSSAGHTASRSTAWWCSSTRPISSACRVSVAVRAGLVGGRPGGELGEQPQLAPDQLVQHPLVGDGAAGGWRRGRPAASSAAGARGPGIAAVRERTAAAVMCTPRSAVGPVLRAAAGAGCGQGRTNRRRCDRGFRIRLPAAGRRRSLRVTDREPRSGGTQVTAVA